MGRPSRLRALSALVACCCVIAPVSAQFTAPDNGSGTATMPPVGAEYRIPAGTNLMKIFDGLPPGTTMQIDARWGAFAAVSEVAGGALGGTTSDYASAMTMPLVGTGALAGYARTIVIPLPGGGGANEMQFGARAPGAPVQNFSADLFRMFGQILGDPDFDLLRLTAGTDFGLPSPGGGSIVQSGSRWQVDSFFDITYRIDFVGASGGPLAGWSGSTTGTVRMQIIGPGECVVADNGTGTATAPFAGCTYNISNGPNTMQIVDGLPPGTTIDVDSAWGLFANVTENPGGGLGGTESVYDSVMRMPMMGTGTLAGYSREVSIPLSLTSNANWILTAPRTPGDPVQTFDTELWRMFGQITGDPDFDLLRLSAGSDFGLPSPGVTRLTKRAGSTWEVDSFFDITYRIDFVGAPSGSLAGMSGSTTGTVRMQIGTALASGLISREPFDDTAIAGQQNASFSVTAQGLEPVTYQWRRAGMALTDGPAPGGGQVFGAETCALIITSANYADAGAYECVVTDASPAMQVSLQRSLTILPSLCPGDADASGQVDFGDINTVLANWLVVCP